eukprot:COSAG02_NODE_2745_length_8108_cov_2699.027469_1_plen_78_part_00
MQRIVLDLVSTLPLVPSHLRYLAFSGGYLSSPFFLGLIGFSNYRTLISDRDPNISVIPTRASASTDKDEVDDKAANN